MVGIYGIVMGAGFAAGAWFILNYVAVELSSVLTLIGV